MMPPDSLLDDLRILEPPDPMRYVYWGLGFLGLVLLFFLVRALVRSFKRRDGGASRREIAAAQEDALAELERLFALVEEGQSKPYAIESSGIVRRYIERRFSIRAPQRSTEEFLH